MNENHVITIRDVRPEDYAVCVGIYNAVRPEPTSVDELTESDRICASSPTGYFRRLVAVDEAGAVVGHGYAEAMSWSPPGRSSVGATVHPDHRGRGVGLALYRALEQVAREHEAKSLDAWVRGEDDASLAWAQRQGFALEKQRTESVLDLAGWSAAPFAEAVERVRASGLRLELRDATLVEDEALMRQIYDVDKTTSPDVPFWDPANQFPAFEEFLKEWREDTSPKTCALAFDGDRLVGMSNVWLPRIPGKAAYNGYTAILREYRGRGLALALKVLTTDSAAAFGAPRMRTNNDPSNAPMLAVNAKLGYKLIPGPRFLVKSLA